MLETCFSYITSVGYALNRVNTNSDKFQGANKVFNTNGDWHDTHSMRDFLLVITCNDLQYCKNRTEKRHREFAAASIHRTASLRTSDKHYLSLRVAVFSLEADICSKLFCDRPSHYMSSLPFL